MQNISDELLLKAYFQAIQQKLHPDFIYLLETEIYQRSLFAKEKVSS